MGDYSDPAEYAPLKLHIPEPAVRPGDTPDFSNVVIPKAGQVARPEVNADPESMRDLAHSIIRVLNRDGEAVGPWAGLLSDEELLGGLRHMMTLRTFDTRMLMAQRQGKTSFYMQHMGEEAVSCAFRKALRSGDMNFPTYRQAGLLIAAGYPLVDIRAILTYGSYHDVDSSEMAFKIAGSMALKKGVRQAKPVLLEPIMAVEVVTPEDYMGDVMGDLSSRRGQLSGTEQRGTATAIRATVPLSEMFGYVGDLRSRTQGRATYSMQFDSYQQVPASIQEEIIKRVRGE